MSIEDRSVSTCQRPSLHNYMTTSFSNHSTITSIDWVLNVASSLAFLTALVGNSAALLVIFSARGRTRLTANQYLANLALADLLRTCLIPFTIISRMKQAFIFGNTLCKLLPFIQGNFVGAIQWTLTESNFEGVIN